MKAGFAYTGFDDYFTALEQASKDINTVSREALAEAGQTLQAEMLIRCPTDKLRPFIKVFTPTAEGDHNYVAVGFVHDLSYTPAWAAIAANSIEFGSVHNAPIPFVRPAVRSVKATINASIAARLKAAGLVDP